MAGTATVAARRRSPWAAVALGAVAAGVAGIDGTAAATRAVMYGGVLVACGVTLFLLLAHDGGGAPAERDRLTWLVLAGAAGGGVATVAGLLLQVAAASGRGWFGMLDSTASEVVLGSAAHLGAGQRLLGLVLLAYAASRRAAAAPAAPLLGLAGVLITLTSFFAAGHTATREPRVVGFTIDLVHTATASIWIGGLIGLAIVLRHRRPDDAAGAAVVLRRFSLAASGCVALLVSSGLGLAWAELAPARGVPFNGYGLVLLAKAAVALAALAVGAVNHFVVVPAAEAGGRDAWSTLANTVTLELGAVVVLVGLTGVLTGLAP